MNMYRCGGGGKPEGLYVWKKHEVINLITFTVSGSSSYQAEEGMTWREWVASSYNTDGFTISSDGKVESNPGYIYITNGQADVTPDDTIIPNWGYTPVGYGGGGN